MDIPGITELVRAQLVKRNIPPESREVFIELFQEVLSSVKENVSLTSNPDLTENLAATLINNKNILAAIQRQGAEMDALKRITRNLTSSLDLQVVLDAVVKEALQLVPNARDAHIFLYEENQLSFGAAFLTDGNENVPLADPRPEGLTYQVAKRKKILTVEDIQKSPLYKDAHPTWVGSIIGIPLLIGDRVLGVMNLARTLVGAFSHSEIRLLNLLSDQAAIAIMNARLHESVKDEALIDSLTGLPNRRALDERLDEEIKRASRTGHTFSVVMMDLDGFKKINDEHGHDVGDSVLRAVSQTFKHALRATDFIARYGGDELTLILPDTGWPDSQIVTDKIREKIKKLSFKLPDGKSPSLTVTGGVALFPPHATTPSNLLRSADEALYRAKRHDRGNFMVAQRNTGQLPVIK